MTSNNTAGHFLIDQQIEVTKDFLQSNPQADDTHNL